ncbi:MAG: hypothetical protein ABL903_10720, partial [Methylococcales bacterium]
MNEISRREFLATTTAGLTLTVMSNNAISDDATQETKITQSLLSAFAATQELDLIYPANSGQNQKRVSLSQKRCLNGHKTNRQESH